VTATYRFGTFELQPDQRRLLEDGRPAALGPRAFDVLVVLVERAGQLVSKHQLLDLVWPGLVVEENNLQVQISTLRKLIGAQAIATIPGRGYRWTLTAIEASARAARSESAPPAMSVESAAPADAPTGLPALYGRSEDVAALRDLVRHHALVTVVGPAGIGKTRLAQAVARELQDAFADGVRLVELAPLADPDLVAATVARALGIVVGDPHTVLDLTVQALAGQRLLLVLDNCEHLLDAVDCAGGRFGR
jgi:DNA-binding winged helix-turn-helix (wHTH) protein